MTVLMCRAPPSLLQNLVVGSIEEDPKMLSEGSVGCIIDCQIVFHAGTGGLPVHLPLGLPGFKPVF